MKKMLSIDDFFKTHGKLIFIFLLMFVVVFSSIKLSTGVGSNGNVEQWINVTNAMFYGNQDFLFSYGPLYWLSGGTTTQYNIFTYWSTIVFLSFVISYFWATTFTLTYKANSYIFFAITYFLFFDALNFKSALYLWSFATVAYLEFSKSSPITLKSKGLIIVGFLIGFSFYVRFFYGIVSLATFSAYFCVDFLAKRRIREFILFAGSVLVSYLFFGMLIFHEVSSIVHYFIINKNLSFGNSVDMTLDRINSRESLIAVTLTSLFMNIYLLIKRRSLFLPINALFLLFFKLGFSRTDHYVGYFVVPVAALALIMLFEKSKLAKFLFALTMGCLYYLLSNPSYPGAPARNPLTLPIDFAVDYNVRLGNSYSSFKLNEEFRRRIGNSKIDVYPYNNEYIFANNLNYWHRPLFQNYMTLTPTLDLMNQHFFESPERPKFVLWTAGLSCSPAANCNAFDGLDKKYSLNEDPLTSSSILLNYHIVSAQKGRNGVPLILLEENNNYTNYSKSVISEEEMRFGQWYKVPKFEGQVIKLIPNLKFTAYGWLKNLLFRGSILKIKYRFTTGEVREYRLNIINSKSGIWISPLLDNFELSGFAIDSIMLESQSSRYFQPTFKSTWLNIPISGVSNRPSPNQTLKSSPSFEREINVSCNGSINSINGIAISSPHIKVAKSFNLQGWLASSTENGNLFDKVFVTLTGDDGKRLFILTDRQDRPDVATAFKNKNLIAAGFRKQIYLAELNGKYILGLAGLRGTELYSCSQFSVPLTVE